MSLALLLACAGPVSKDSGVDSATTVRHHPVGYAASAVHGLDAKLQSDACGACHGDDFSGGVAPSCDTCHEAGWRDNCTFCHGGKDDPTGAPPEGIRDEADVSAATFPVHTTHVNVSTSTRALDCVECHTRPTDALTPGHVFVGDTTPGVAEVTFDMLLSAEATWDGAGTCGTSYCHGTGAGADGTVTGTSRVSCGGCHPSSVNGAERMSGEHLRHISEDLLCAECHAGVGDDFGGIADKDRHLDGQVTIAFAADMVFDGATCTGTCHFEDHAGRAWRRDTP